MEEKEKERVVVGEKRRRTTTRRRNIAGEVSKSKIDERRRTTRIGKLKYKKKTLQPTEKVVETTRKIN